MEKLNRLSGNRSTRCPRQRAHALAPFVIFLLSFAAQITRTIAQTLSTSTNTPSSYVINKPGNAALNSEITGVLNKTEHIAFYPDVVSDYLLVMLPTPAATDILVTIHDTTGKLLATDTIAAGATNTVLDMKHTQPGTYVVTIDNTADKQIVRLVKN